MICDRALIFITLCGCLLWPSASSLMLRTETPRAPSLPPFYQVASIKHQSTGIMTKPARQARKFTQCVVSRVQLRPATSALMLSCLATFCFQAVSEAGHGFLFSFLGKQMNPLTKKLAFKAFLPHEAGLGLLTSVFVHGDGTHLALSMLLLHKIPGWLERGQGSSLFLTTFFVSSVVGRLVSTIPYVLQLPLPPVLALGSTAGISGLVALLFVHRQRLSDDYAAVQAMKFIISLLLLGSLMDPTVVTNIGNLGGFLGGLGVAFLFGPRYGHVSEFDQQDMSARLPFDVRNAIGFDRCIRPSLIHLKHMWMLLLLPVLTRRGIYVSPLLIIRAVVKQV